MHISITQVHDDRILLCVPSTERKTDRQRKTPIFGCLVLTFHTSFYNQKMIYAQPRPPPGHLTWIPRELLLKYVFGALEREREAVGVLF